MNNIVILMVVMVVTTYLVRMIPFTAMRRKITNRYVKSVLYYMPYAILSAMTIPAVFTATGDICSSLAGFAIGMILALTGRSLVTVALGSSIVSLIIWIVMK